MKTRVVIFGVSGHAKAIVDIIESNNLYTLAGFIDKNIPPGTKVMGYDVIGNDQSLNLLMEKYQFKKGVIGIGDNFTRSRVAQFVKESAPEFQFVNCIHSSSNISNYADLGVGNVIMPGVTVNASSVIKNHCILNTNSSLDHDGCMSDFSCLAPNSAVGGNCSIGEFSFIGMGASVFNNISIGSNCVIGGGSLVNRHIPSDTIAYGVPAKQISENRESKYLL